jgi:oligopeptide transport system substrate-binding protein
MRRPAALVFGLLCVLSLFLAGCAKRETPVEAGIRTQTLHLGNGAEPQDLDPQIVTAYTDYLILMALFEGLTVIDEATSQAVPGTAERWEVSPDGLLYTFAPTPNGPTGIPSPRRISSSPTSAC